MRLEKGFAHKAQYSLQCSYVVFTCTKCHWPWLGEKCGDDSTHLVWLRPGTALRAAGRSWSHRSLSRSKS